MSAAGRRRVLVTHADQPLGRRIVKRLFHDDDVESLVAVGDGPPPRSFDHFLGSSAGRLRYQRLDIARHRPVAELFRAEEKRSGPVDSVIHVPCHGPSESPERPIVAGVPSRTAEARLVLQQCLQARSIHHLVVVGSAFVYRLAPGNANRLTEASELELDPEAPAELRSWVDCDMIFRGEIGARDPDAREPLRIVLLRAPTVVSSGGAIFLHPTLSSATTPALRPLGYDPMCALIADKDVVGAVRTALYHPGSGVFNVAGAESLPLSVLSRWAGHASVGVPSPVLRIASRAARFVGSGWLRLDLDGTCTRNGFTLDTRRAEQDLGFRPSYRIGLARAGDGRLRIETAPV